VSAVTDAVGVVPMPKLSDAMEDGTIVAWLIDDGAPVAEGEELVEIETDKATAVYPAPAAGRLRRLAAVGETIAVGDPIADLSGDEAADPGPASVASPAPDAAPAAARAPESVGAGAPRRRPMVSPLARRAAAEAGVDLSAVTGSGPRGRISRRDVEAHLRRSAAAHPAATPAGATPIAPASVAPTTAAATSAASGSTRAPLTRSARLVGERMTRSRAEIPDFQTTVAIDMEECVRLRESVRALGAEAPVPSFNDMVLKACALALREHPRVNASWAGDALELHEHVHVAMAVADGARLLAPVVRHADRLGMRALAAETRRLAGRVREQTISPEELEGATFTVSNLGMLGVDEFTAVITPGQAAILAVGAVAPRAVVRDGALVARTTMRATLSADHRIVYGADAASFLASVRGSLEQPLSLLV
jgi:pyruvate dehydrogenase E2 component (dihydrolipoamide acetyltransferase)